MPRREILAALSVLVIALVAASLALGAGRIGWHESLAWLLQGLHSGDAYTDMVLGDLRAPRLLKALGIGAALAVSGVLLQTLTRNPLAEAGLLGVNAGAALAIAMGLAMSGALAPHQQIAWALAGSLVGSALAWLVGGRGEASPLRLVLAGLALAATCQGLTAWATLGRAANLDQFRFWVLGSLAHSAGGLLAPSLWLIAIGLAGAAMLHRPLGALHLGDEVARSLGTRIAAIRAAVIAIVALLAGTAVALAGPIAFLGLLAPYFARRLAGVSMGSQLLYSALVGAVLLLAADLVARLVVAPYEAPVSALLALIGAPLLIFMVRADGQLALGRSGMPA